MNTNRFLRQKAVYWASPVSNGEGGFAFDAPVEIDCRWADTQERFMNPLGEEVLSTSIITPDRDVDLNGYLWLGLLEDLTTAQKANPQLLEHSRPIAQYSKVPSVKADQFRRKAWL